MTAATLFHWPSDVATSLDSTIEVIGVPTDFGNGITSGARYGPAAIREASLTLACAVTGLDRGDIGRHHRGDWQDVLAEVEQIVGDMVRRDVRPIMLGGDHGISYAAVAAARKYQPLNIVWFDAHTDFCRQTSDEWHDHKQVLRRISALDHVGRIVQIGHRGMTYFDEITRFNRLSVVTAREGSVMTVDELLALLPIEEPVYVSIDIDALDPRWAPGTGHPVPGGFTVTRLSELARTIAEHRQVVGLDLMEVNPMLDIEGKTSAAAAALIAGVVPAMCRTAAVVDYATVSAHRE